MTATSDQLPDPTSLDLEAILSELAHYLRPPGQGIHTVSTGKSELRAKTQAYMGKQWRADQSWREHLRGVTEAKVAMLAIPCDTGAGIVRGCARGPEAIREGLGSAPCFELGDVFCVPHFLDEDMLSEAQRQRTQAVIYAEVPEARRAAMPVSPLGIARRVYRLVAAANPALPIMMLGGDHSVSWAPVDALFAADPADNADIGIVHFDAHTDLLAERLGVRICFATWAYHANRRLGGGGRMIQLGIRASGRDRGHWEKQEDLRQIWPDEAEALGAQGLARAVLEHLRERGLRRIYVTNDIDGTDAHYAGACGTPEGGGLHPDQVAAVLEALTEAKDLQVFGADMVELAPALGIDGPATARSIETAVRYTRLSVEMLEKRG
jgi:agmatinase